MVGSLLLRGMLVGAVAGLLAFGFARVFGEPEVDRAISFEEMTKAAPHAHGDAPTHSDAHAHGDAHTHSAAQASTEAQEPELVSRATQSGIGLATVVHFARLGHDVYAGVRSPSTATELDQAIETEKLPIRRVAIDVNDDASVAEASAMKQC